MSQLYLKGRKKIVDGTVDLLADDIAVVGIDVDLYTFSTTHEFLSSVPSGARIATSGLLGGKAVLDGGVFNADDDTFTAPASGDTIGALAVIHATGDPATSELLAYIDSGSGLPYETNAADIAITFDNGAYKVFQV